MRRAMAAVLMLGALGGCGDGAGEPPATTTTEAPTTTVTTQANATGIACLNNATAALKLKNDFNLASRGVIAPDPEPYRQSADVLRAEQARLGCPGELLRGFPDG